MAYKNILSCLFQSLIQQSKMTTAWVSTNVSQLRTSTDMSHGEGDNAFLQKKG